MPTNTRSRAKLPIMIAAWLLVAVIALIGSGLAGTTQAQGTSGVIPSINLDSNEAGQLIITWETPEQEPTDYRLMWANTNLGFPSYKNPNEAERANEYPLGDVTTITLNNLTPGDSYKVKIRSRYYNADRSVRESSGPWTSTATQRVKDHPPAAPTGLTASLVEHNSLTLTWNDPQDTNITGYRIQRGTDANSLHTIEANTGSPSTNYTDSTVEPETTYHYAVQALSQDGNGARAITSGTTPAEPDETVQNDPPAVPTGLTASNVQHDSLTLTWDDPKDDGITGYQVMRGDSATSLSTLQDNTQSVSTEYEDDTVEPETTYHYGVVALSANGDSPQSSTLSATTPAEPSSGEEDETREPPKKEDPPQRVGPRQSTTTTFISNTGQTSNADLTTTRATAFTTGTSTYTLSSVGIHLSAQSGTPTPLVQIYGDTSGNLGTLLATMNNPGSITDNVVNTYTDPANTMLSGSTTYWVVTSNSAAVNGQGFRVRTTDTNNLDSGTAAGWTIGSALYKTNITFTSWLTSTSRHLFEIRGTRTDAASGVPAITAPNVFRVPAVLGVDLSGITDTDGVTNIATNATYKWQRFNAAGTTLETDSIGTGSTYTLTHTDATKTLKVVVNFTDDASNSEGPLTSAATSAITAAATDCNAPTYVGGATQLGPARTVTIAQGNDSIHGLAYGFRKSDAYGSLDNTTFTTGTAYEILGIYNVKTLTYIRLDKALTRPNQRQLALHVCDQAYSFGPELSDFGYSFSNPHQDWSPYAERTFYLSQDTTAPTFVSATVNGTTLVITLNEPLDDALNLANSAFTVKKNGSSTPISSTTPVISGRTVTLTLTRAVSTSDTNVLVSYNKPTSGTASKLRDTFHNETATFTDQVVSNTAATGAPTISGIAQVGQTLTASTTSISDANGLPSTFNYQWKRVDANGTSNSTNIGTDSATYTLTDSEVGKKVLVEVSFTDNANNREGPLVSAAFPSSGTVSAAPSEVPSSWSLKPTSLAVGDQFRLIFLSSTKRNATSTDIADYNTFVQERAAAGHAGIQSYSTGFRVVGCTGAVDARDNTDTTGRGVPIYWLDGTKVADNYADFYDGSWDDEINDKNESGTDAHDTSQEDKYPFTGCQNDGTEELAGAHRPRSLGSTDNNVRIGRLNSSGTLQDPIDGNDVATTAATRPMYGLSAVFQVVAASTDATLSALTVSPKDITGFATDRSTRYEVGVASTVTQATITETTNESAATVGYSTTDADDSTSGHQVDLSAGRNRVTVTVTAEDTITTQTYTISINRGVDTAFGWKATDDFDGLITAGNDTPSGPWSDETTMWVSDYVDDKIYAYDLTTKARDASKDFDTLSDAGNENPDGIWSNNITMWVSDYEDSKLYAYSMATKARDPGKDITTAAASAGIWSDGTTMWVANQSLVKIQAYTLATGVRDAGKDFDTLTPAGNDYPGGIWSNNTTMWVTDQTDTKIYAYNMASKAHDAGKDFDTLSTADNDRGVGIWANTDTMWVADLQDDKIYSYNMPAIAANTAPTVANAIPDQMATVGTEFSYTFLANTFNDVDATDTLTYTATKGDGAVLPTWLMFAAGTRTFSGTPTAAETVSVKVTASDGTTSVSDEFDITVSAAITEVPADWGLKPTDVAAGSQFRLIFLSSTKRDATPTAIATYNTFVQNLAAAGHTHIRTHSTGFTAVGCTADVDARDNTSTTYISTNKGVPIYWLNGAKVADQYEDFYDGSWDDEANDKNESGTNGLNTSLIANYPNTGCKHDGTESTLGMFTSLALGSSADTIRAGRPNSSVSGDGPISGDDTAARTATRPMYGLSGVFQVADATNTPAAGAPSITAPNVFRVPAVLSVDLSGITDTDGVTNIAATATYKWQRFDATGTNLEADSIGTDPTYTLTDTDAGKTIKVVVVSFTDDATNSEGPLSSSATSAITAAATDCNTPTYVGGATQIWTGKLGVKSYGLFHGFHHEHDESSLDNPTFTTQSSSDYEILVLNNLASNSSMTIQTDPALSTTDKRTLVLHICDQGPYEFRLSPLSGDNHTFLNTGQNWSTHAERTIYLSQDTAAPTFTSATVNASTLVVTLSEDLGTAASLANGAFTVKKGSSGTAQTLSGTPSISGSTVTLTLATAVTATDTAVKVAYAKPTSGSANKLRDRFSNETATFTDQEVTNNTTTTTTEVPETWSLKPTGLNTGDQFRLIFLSSTKRNASPNTIADYNTFVQGRAAAGHNDIQSYSTGFRVVGCTEAVDARDNTATTFTTNDKGVPIYWLNGTKVADEYEDFYDGSWDDEANDKDESGTDGLDASLNANRPLTGCDDDGTEAVDFANRSVALGSSLGVMIGRPNFATAGPLSSSTHSLPSVTRPMYGLSEVFEVSNVPAAISDVAVVPEPRTTDSLRVSWTAPNNTGKPALTAYDLRYKEFDADNWTTARQDDAASTSLIIDGLRTAYYDVQVRAINAEYSGPWSSTAEGATSPPSETVLANHPLIPADLGPGDSFRLLHVTSGTRAATGTGIHKYHDSVGSDPILLVDPSGLMDEWGGIFLHQRALVSTPGADARLHTDTTWTGTDRGVPIYWINGTRVADDYADLYDGAWDNEANPMNGFGEPRSLSGTAPWTGTSHDGTELFEGGVSRAVGQSMVGVGGPGSNVVGAGPLNGGVTFASTEERPLYGLWHVMVIDENLRLVSNLTQSRSDASSDDRATVRAQLFTTGPNSSGYGIARIKVDRGSETEDFLGTVALYTTDAQGDPDLANGLHATLSLESTFAYQWYLTAPVGTVVKPNTTYSLVFQGDGGTYPELWTSGADGEDLAAEGWSIADVLRYHDGSNWVDNGNGKSLRMRIIGTLAADTTEVPSNWGLKPTAVAAGSQFRLIFLSSTKRNGSSTAIADYNTFVQARAAAGHTDIRSYSTGFTAVGCTADVDARDNTSTTFTTEDKGVPIYWLNGAKVANEYEDFYDGSWDDEVNDKDESGTNGLDISQPTNRPFTGCDHDGTEALDGSISQGFGAASGAKIGRPNSSNSAHGPLSSNAVGTITDTRPMYGISEIFQVAESTNAPATGVPTISGTATAGQTLTASTTDISDTDGLPSAFTYQWKRVDSDGASNPTNIGTDSATYTLTASEVGKKVLVEVRFTDNANNSEGPLASAAYPSTGTVRAADNTAPTVTSIERQDPTELLTNSDTPTWRVIFSEAVKNVDGTDFTIAGTTATPTATPVTLVMGGYDVTPTGGNIASLTGTITLTFASAQNIADTADNDLAATGPTGTNEPTFELDNTVPTFDSGTANGVLIVLTFSEALDPDSLPPGAAFDISTSTSVTVDNVSIAGTMVTLTVTPAILVDQHVVVSNNAYDGAGYAPLKDFAGNEVLPAVQTGRRYTLMNNTPIGPPASLRAEPGDGRVRLVWENPEGIPGFIGYEYRYAVGTSVPAGTSWTGTGSVEALTLLLSGFANGTAHAFEVRATRSSGVGATTTVSATPLAAVCNTNLGDRREVWSATMTVGRNDGPRVGAIKAGYNSGIYGSFPTNDDRFSIGAASHTIEYLYTEIRDERDRRRMFLELVGESRFTPAVKDALRFHWCSESSGFDNPTGAGYRVSNHNEADWSIYSTRELALSLPANNPASGVPTITGEAVTAQTLTASTTGISDPDGLPSAFNYQWKRVDSDGVSNPTNIGADSATYMLTNTEVGKKVKVEVSFTDSLGEVESLDSAAHPSTGTVRAADNTAPTVTSIERQDPTEPLTNSDTPTWRVTFSEAVKNVDATDFTITGTTAAPMVTSVGGVTGGYDVTPSGGNIATLTGTITLTFAAAQNIADTADNRLTATMPTVTNEPTFDLDNTIPRFDSGTANGTMIVLTFSEELDPDSLPPGSAFAISTSTSGTADSVSIAGTMVTLTVTPAILVDQHVVVSNNAYAGNSTVPLKDFAGNEVLPAVQSSSYTITNNTPIGPPTDLTAEAGDGRVRLVWTKPAGISGLFDYQYRYAAGTSVPVGTSWTTGSDEGLTALVQGLVNGTTHAFELRAVRGGEVGATATVSATPITAVCNTDLGDRRDVWSATMTVGRNISPQNSSTEAGYRRGGSDSLGSFPTNHDSFMIGGVSYTVSDIYTFVGDEGGRRRITLTPANTGRFTPAVKDAIQLHWCGESSGFDNPIARGYQVSNDNDADWSLYNTRELALSLPANNPATGKPAITGGALIGQTLTATTGTVADTDGLPTAFNYQWKRVDSDGVSNPTNISSDSANYTLTSSEVGKKVLVEVSFTDSLTGVESRTSDAHPSSRTVTVGGSVALREDSYYAFEPSDFSYAISSGTIASLTITEMPASGTLTKGGRPINNLPDTISTTGSKRRTLLYRPPTDAHGTPYTTFKFKVNEETTVHTMAINVTPVNDPAYGQVFITGTTQMGYSLTAFTSAMGDRDGIPRDQLSYQWKRYAANGTTFEANIGTNSSTYTLTVLDVGKKIRLEVSYVDGGGTSEATLSEAFPYITDQTVGEATFQSIMGAAGDTFYDFTADHGQVFTTGTHPNGYTLSRVVLQSEDLQGDDLAVKICGVNTNGDPTAVCTDLTVPGSFTKGLLSFTAPSNTTLNGGRTNYIVVISSPGSDSVRLDATRSDGFDSSALGSGWSIATKTRMKTTEGWKNVNGTRIRIAILGTINP